jgi:quercetin 2,3-dioxygenase
VRPDIVATVNDPVLEVVELGSRWPTVDPFLFCVHHDDAYPRGNGRLGPDAPLDGRDLGQDFSGRDGWSMYHGSDVPGFPQHPHRGFETVTLVRRGFIDHSDSLGATARFGNGDVQWLTAGSGIVHCEMFPLLDDEQPNPVELFQIWLNLPASDKRVDPYFTMLWNADIPRHVITDDDGRRIEITVVAGALAGVAPPPPPPNSWASRPDSDLAIWAIRLDAGARWELPPARSAETVRTLYAFEGNGLRVADRDFDNATGMLLQADVAVPLVAGDEPVECLLLQARPIGEPVAQYGPFVMNTEAEIEEAFADYRRTQFGGWPWPVDDPTHGPDRERFARVPEPA